jgi:hypothetical protein
MATIVCIEGNAHTSGFAAAQAAATDDAPKKKTGETIKYSKEFLLKFTEVVTH